MKNLLKPITYLIFVFTLCISSCSKEETGSEQEDLQHQITLKSTGKSLAQNSFEPGELSLIDGNLHLGTMLENFQTKKRNYLMNVSTTAILNKGRTSAIVGYSLREYTYWEVGSRGYWRADNSINRSDTAFATSNHFEVLVYPDPSSPNLVDENRILITWRSPELGLNTFTLDNVSVYYVTDGILINGSYKIKNTPIGVSISITPK